MKTPKQTTFLWGCIRNGRQAVFVLLVSLLFVAEASVSAPVRSTRDKLVNTGIDILPTMLDFAGIPVPEKLPGRSVRPIALGQTPSN